MSPTDVPPIDMSPIDMSPIDVPPIDVPLHILVPFYGDPALLRRTVASVLTQDCDDWRLTVVDDGYPDPAVAAFFAGLDHPRVSYLRNDTNLGANRNYRRCLDLAETELVVLLGADDELLPHYASTVLRLQRQFPSAAVIQPGVEIINGTGAAASTMLDAVKRWIRPRGAGARELSGEPLAASLLRGNWLYFPALAFAREPAQRIGFRSGLDVVQDLALVLDLVAAGGTVVLDDTVCFRYRRHEASDSSVRALAGTRFLEERRFFLDAAEQCASLGWHRAARAARQHLLSRLNALTVLARALRAGQWAGAQTLVRHALGRPAEGPATVHPAHTRSRT